MSLHDWTGQAKAATVRTLPFCAAPKLVPETVTKVPPVTLAGATDRMNGMTEKATLLLFPSGACTSINVSPAGMVAGRLNVI